MYWYENEVQVKGQIKEALFSKIFFNLITQKNFFLDYLPPLFLSKNYETILSLISFV